MCPWSTSDNRGTYPPNIIYRGDIAEKKLPEGVLDTYEQTSASIEEVVGRIAMKGTAINQAKLHDGNVATIPGAIFIKQYSHQPLVSSKPSSNHAENGEPCDVRIGNFIYYGLILASETVTFMGDLEGAPAGKHRAKTTGIPASKSLEAFTASGDQFGLMISLIGVN